MNRKIAVVTGGSQGIGLSIAKRLVAKDFYVVILGRSKEKLESANKEIDSSFCSHFSCDVRKKDEVQKVFQTIKNDFGSINTLVNCAGIVKDAPLLRMKNEDIKDVFETNYFSVVSTCSAACRQMISKKDGCIINIGSVVGSHGNAGQVAYSSSKAALIGLSKSLAKEFGSYNIRVNLLEPGFIETQMTAELSAKKKEDLISSTALKRLGQPDDIADCVEFLARNTFITGQVIKIDGGLYI